MNHQQPTIYSPLQTPVVGFSPVIRNIMLTDEAIEELRQIWKEETGEEVTEEEARAMGMRILKLFQLLEKAPASTDSNSRMPGCE